MSDRDRELLKKLAKGLGILLIEVQSHLGDSGVNKQTGEDDDQEEDDQERAERKALAPKAAPKKPGGIVIGKPKPGGKPAPKAAPKAGPKVPGKPKPAPKEEPEEEEDEPEEHSTKGLDDMSRPELIRYVKQHKLDVETTGRKLGDLLADIKKAEGGGKAKPGKASPAPAKGKAAPKAAPKSGISLKVLQAAIAEVVEDNYDELEESIEALGCKGDCMNCPAPEEDSVELQVRACLKSVIEFLGPKLNIDEKIADEVGAEQDIPF